MALVDRLAQACGDPGSIAGARQEGEPLSRWGSRAVLAVLEGKDGPLGKIREIHTPWGIYTECGHEHTEAELEDEASSIHEVDLVGLVCAEGLMYRVCRSCCVEPGWAEGYQTETCSAKHTHSVDGPVCPTTAALDGVEMPGVEKWS